MQHREVDESVDQAGESATQTLHRLTSFTWGWYARTADDPDLVWSPPVDDSRVRADIEVNDLSRLPWFYKRYASALPRLSLPRDLPPTTPSAVAVLAGIADIASSEPDLAQLSRVLHLSAGVVRTMARPFGTWLFRAAGSAGGRFPLELYVAVPEGTPLPPGVHWYDPSEHALVEVGPPPGGGAPAIVVTGIPWRTGWRYRERGFRHVYWDAGTMLAQLLAVAGSAGLASALYTRFPDTEVAELVGADGIHEWPVALVTLDEGRPALRSSGPAAVGRIDAKPEELPLVTAAQRGGDGDVLGTPWDPGSPVDLPSVVGDPIESVVLKRGSLRRMDPTRGVPGALLRTSMAAAMRGIDVGHRVVVHDVDGLAPGVYRWPELSAPVRPGAMRGELHRVCLEQGLARDAAFVVIGATDIGALDDRAYREAQLAAGLVEGRLHLLAYALGAGASGMTFIDEGVPGLLGEPLDPLLFTCVGVRDYASALGGPPGAPTAVRKVLER